MEETIVIINSKYFHPVRASHLQKVKPSLRVTQLLAKAKEDCAASGKASLADTGGRSEQGRELGIWGHFLTPLHLRTEAGSCANARPFPLLFTEGLAT